MSRVPAHLRHAKPEILLPRRKCTESWMLATTQHRGSALANPASHSACSGVSGTSRPRPLEIRPKRPFRREAFHAQNGSHQQRGAADARPAMRADVLSVQTFGGQRICQFLELAVRGRHAVVRNREGAELDACLLAKRLPRAASPSSAISCGVSSDTRMSIPSRRSAARSSASRLSPRGRGTMASRPLAPGLIQKTVMIEPRKKSSTGLPPSEGIHLKTIPSLRTSPGRTGLA